jgi:SAM-dependent methyltransferase
MSEWEESEGDHWAANADRYTKMLAGFGEIVVDAARLGAGARVLDVGCGCGDLSLTAGHAVGPTGAVRGVDLSPAMLTIARRRAAGAGLNHVDFVVADAAKYRVGPAGFDVVVSRFGVMFFDDPVAAFANMRSLMAPGGRLVFVCWQDLFVNDWMIVPGAAVAEVLPLPVGDDPDAPGPFTFAEPDRVTGILTSAGFTNPAAVAVTTSLWMGETAEDAAGFLRTTGLGRAVFDGADPGLVDEAMKRATAVLVPHETSGGVMLDGAAWLVTASM